MEKGITHSQLPRRRHMCLKLGHDASIQDARSSLFLDNEMHSTSTNRSGIEVNTTYCYDAITKLFSTKSFSWQPVTWLDAADFVSTLPTRTSDYWAERGARDYGSGQEQVNEILGSYFHLHSGTDRAGYPNNQHRVDRSAGPGSCRHRSWPRNWSLGTKSRRLDYVACAWRASRCSMHY